VTQHMERHRLRETGIPNTPNPIAAQRVVEELSCTSVDALLESLSTIGTVLDDALCIP